jgi:amino-acid N-acetyltransferase
MATKANMLVTPNQQQVTLRPATRADLPTVEHLLRTLGLPTAGVAEWVEHFWIADHGGTAVGVVGVEQYGDEALLRSLAVDPSWRSAGLGRALIDAALRAARAAGAQEMYLLTTTAEHYFPRFGFVRIGRDDVSGAVLQSVEFREACPASAVVMRTERLALENRVKEIGQTGAVEPTAGTT